MTKVKATPIWNFYERNRERETATCKICRRVLKAAKGTTTSITKHVIIKHPEEGKIFIQMRLGQNNQSQFCQYNQF